MIGNYLNEPDKYLYKLVNNMGAHGTVYYIPNCHDSIENLMQYNREYLLDTMEPSITIAVFRKEQSVLPSELDFFNEARIFNLLQEASEHGRKLDHICNTPMFSTIPYQKIKELTEYINNFLDCNIVDKNCHVIGERVQDIVLTKDEYTKYL